MYKPSEWGQKKKYSEIPLLRPPKLKHLIYLKKIKKWFFSSFSTHSVPLNRVPPLGQSKSGLKDHFWTLAKVVLI